MEAIVLAGGKGSRLGYLTSNLPKPMLEVAGRPFLDYVLDFLVEEGVTYIVVSVGYLSEKIIRHYQNSYRGVKLDYAIERQPLGTGGGIRQALGCCREDNVFVLNGDTLFRISLKSMMAAQKKSDAVVTIGLKRIDDCARYGKIELQAGYVTRFKEKGEDGEGLINAGVYLVQRYKAVSDLQEGHSSFEKEFITPKLQTEVIVGVVDNAEFIDIGVPDDYSRAQELLGNAHASGAQPDR